MNRSRLTRRALLGSTFSLMTFLRSGGAGGRGRGQDRGIGGTGHIAENPDDRGIGGTGVIGTIRKFGSIVVNDMRIAYPGNVEVEIDGRTASPADLRVGQVAQVVAMPSPTGLTTRRISVVSEVIGPIEAIGKGALTVLGQSVSTQFISARGWKLGQWIAVSGLRKLDGTVVASHVQYRDDSIARVSGPVTVTSEGVAKIGGLALANLDASLVGQRVMADVGRIDGEPAAARAIVNPQLSAMPGVRRLSIEAYVERSGDKDRFGSGLDRLRRRPCGHDDGAGPRLRHGRRQPRRQPDRPRPEGGARARIEPAGSRRAAFGGPAAVPRQDRPGRSQDARGRQGAGRSENAGQDRFDACLAACGVQGDSRAGGEPSRGGAGAASAGGRTQRPSPLKPRITSAGGSRS